MAINTKSVAGRRKVRYESFEQFLRDAERIALTDSVQTLGNWSAGQIFKHLADSIESSIDGVGFKLPLPLRVLFTLLMKRKYLYGSLPAGYQAPKALQPEPIDTQSALVLLRKAVARILSESKRDMHPAFGTITREEWDQFHLRHCEMHMSFIEG